MLKKTLLAAAVFAFATTAVQANEVSGYVTGSIGQARADKPKLAKEMQDYYTGAEDHTSSDRTDLAYKIAVGLKVNPYVALEAQYIDLGKMKYKGIDSNISGYEDEKVEFKTSGLGANLVGTLPFDEFSLFAKAGYHYLKTKGSYKYIYEDTSPYTGSKTVRKWTPSFGVGASYNITSELAIVAEYERYVGVSDEKINYFGDKISMKHDIDFASIGLRYNF
jgi:OOP family OmpA-OmpF porin